MTEKQTEQYLYMQLIEEDCYIDTKEKIEYPPVALSYGEQLIKSRSRMVALTPFMNRKNHVRGFSKKILTIVCSSPGRGSNNK